MTTTPDPAKVEHLAQMLYRAYEDGSTDNYEAARELITNGVDVTLPPEPEWKPGDIAVGTVRGVSGVQVMYAEDASEPWHSVEEFGGSWWHPEGDVTDLRRVHLLTEDTLEQIAKVVKGHAFAAPLHRDVERGYNQGLEDAIEAIRSFPLEGAR